MLGAPGFGIRDKELRAVDLVVRDELLGGQGGQPVGEGDQAETLDVSRRAAVEAFLVERQVAVLQVVKDLGALAAPGHIAQRVGIELGGNDLLA